MEAAILLLASRIQGVYFAPHWLLAGAHTAPGAFSGRQLGCCRAANCFRVSAPTAVGSMAKVEPQ